VGPGAVVEKVIAGVRALRTEWSYQRWTVTRHPAFATEREIDDSRVVESRRHGASLTPAAICTPLVL
ncbi:MAG: hypothetical protein ACRDVD_07090, partial [Acidimicrobiia bacterium]